MTKNFVAYFKSENDAEAAKAKLEKLRVSNLLVDEVPEGEKRKAFIPIVGMGTPGTMSTGAGAMGIINTSEDSRDEHGEVTHLLEGKVEQEDYDEAISLLSESKGYESQ
ncbi:hypothetical protein [Oceanobacillus manasiensis]|uniref:hypothetical protein n=1 Tax=Oceanobacillus manasiensis TaxID=586413 RepID=UPI0005A73D52|nr:hypothetical protein [Oceanobacillus manasiensis]